MAEDTLTITLTGRAPVRIRRADWPVIASAAYHDGADDSEANRRWRLTVRQHADGRVVVYGVYASSWQGERDCRGGELVAPGEDIAEAIYRVADHLGFRWLADDAIADLPAEEI